MGPEWVRIGLYGSVSVRNGFRDVIYTDLRIQDRSTRNRDDTYDL